MSICQELQQKADEYLIINPAALQILMQISHSGLQLQQAVIRASNNCGCVKLSTKKTLLPKEASWQDLKNQPTGDELQGLCPECRSLIKDKMGSMLFYIAALANAFDIDMDEIIQKEINQLDILGYFMLM